MIDVPIAYLPHGLGLALPERATAHAAGLDLRAALPEGETWTLAPGERRLVPTGLSTPRAPSTPITGARSPSCSSTWARNRSP